MAKRDAAGWMRIYDSSPVADIDPSALYRKETSDDGGRTWEYPRPTTGEFLMLDMAEALYAQRSVDSCEGVVTIQSPHPIGGLIRYTPTP
ncbi:hypothetical protein ACFV4X_12780 [Streptomyces ardesiacus]|uniref:hypothetical protein n=1 Tax=Streptomyces ardesiacus TaxID=285564 RepID=UPI003649FF54